MKYYLSLFLVLSQCKHCGRAALRLTRNDNCKLSLATPPPPPPRPLFRDPLSRPAIISFIWPPKPNPIVLMKAINSNGSQGYGIITLRVNSSYRPLARQEQRKKKKERKKKKASSSRVSNEGNVLMKRPSLSSFSGRFSAGVSVSLSSPPPHTHTPLPS